MTNGRVEVSAWDPENLFFAGRVFTDGDNPNLVFYYDRNDQTVLGRAEQGVSVPPAEISAALGSDDPFAVEDALAALRRGHLQWNPNDRDQLLSLLDGGPDGQVDIARQAGGGLYALADGGFLETRTQISSFAPASTRNPLQVNAVRANFQELFAGRDRVGDEPERSFPGVFESTSSADRRECRSLDWKESCGITITLFCSGLAYWNEGNTIVVSEWSGVLGEGAFPDRQPDLATIRLDIDAATWINNAEFERGRHPRKPAAVGNGSLENCTV